MIQKRRDHSVVRSGVDCAHRLRSAETLVIISKKGVRGVICLAGLHGLANWR